MPLHPFVHVVLDRMKGLPAISDGSPAEARALIAAGREGLGEGPELPKVETFDLPTRAGAIRARLLVPDDPQGVCVYLHGGGWVISDIDDYDALGRTLAKESGCAVLLPDYRLAPEHPFPAGLEDSEDAILWAAEHAATAYARPLPLSVAGDSAGGNLATVAARRLDGRVRIVFQGLVYPVTDCDFARPSYGEHAEGFPLKRRDMPWFFNHYAPVSLQDGPDISPLRASSLAGLPPATVVVAEYDVLADEGDAYAQALATAGVPVVHRRVNGMVHGFIRWHNLCEPAREQVELLARDIAEHSARAEAPA